VHSSLACEFTNHQEKESNIQEEEQGTKGNGRFPRRNEKYLLTPKCLVFVTPKQQRRNLRK
jgi:hypothetical protein